MKTKTNAMEGVVVSYNVVVKTLTAEEKQMLAQHEALFAKTFNPLNEYRALGFTHFYSHLSLPVFYTAGRASPGRGECLPGTRPAG